MPSSTRASASGSDSMGLWAESRSMGVTPSRAAYSSAFAGGTAASCRPPAARKMGDAPGHQLGDLGDHDAAQGVPDDDASAHPFERHRVGHGARIGADARLSRLGGPPAMAGKVQGDDPVPLGHEPL